MPKDDTHSTEFDLDSGQAVFVNPYTLKVLGTTDPGGGIVGLANRLHGFLNNDTATVRLPSFATLFDDGPMMREFVVGDMVLEVFTCWAMLLVVSGLFLWWPRKSRAQGGRVKHGVVKPAGAEGPGEVARPARDPGHVRRSRHAVRAGDRPVLVVVLGRDVQRRGGEGDARPPREAAELGARDPG